MNKTKTITELKNEIIALLLLDSEQILNKIQVDFEEYTITEKQANSIVNHILKSKSVETIENNLFDLYSSKKDLPDFIKCIYQSYRNALSIKNKSVKLPSNYTITSIEYIKAQQAEATEKIAESEKLLSKLLGDSKNIRQEFEERINKTKDSIILLTVTVLGIFSSLTFSLSGSLSILNNVFDTGNSLAETLFKFSLIGIFVADLIFLLIYTIAKINNKSIAMHCSRCKTTSYICQNCDVRNGTEENAFKFKKECFGCEHKNTSCQECQEKRKTIFCKMRHKFYYIYFINIVCVIVMVISLFMGITGHGNFSFNDNNSNNSVVSDTVDSSNENSHNEEEHDATQSTSNVGDVTQQTETTTSQNNASAVE